MVQKEDAKLIDTGIQHLYQLGNDEVHIFAQAGVRISKQYDHALHQDDAWTCPLKLWKVGQS